MEPLSEPADTAELVHFSNCLVHLDGSGSCCVLLTNPTGITQKFEKGSCIGLASEVECISAAEVTRGVGGEDVEVTRGVSGEDVEVIRGVGGEVALDGGSWDHDTSGVGGQIVEVTRGVGGEVLEVNRGSGGEVLVDKSSRECSRGAGGSR